MTKNLKLLNMFIVGFSLCVFNFAAADSLDDQINASISAYLAKNQTSDHMSAVQLSVLLPHEHQSRDYVVGTQYFGTPPKATTDMMFQWGSITKEYTNVLIFQLVHQGLFKTTDTLGNLLPSYFNPSNKTPWPAAWKSITINQLMNMTSGIPSDNDTDATNHNVFYSSNDLINLAVTDQNKNSCPISDGCFPAGSNYFYSNTNYIILGLIIQKFSGMTYADALNTNILTKFQKKNPINLYYDDNHYPTPVLKNMVHSYYPYTSSQKITVFGDWTNWSLSWAKSAGALTGNMKTLVQMTHALYHDNLAKNIQIKDLQKNMVQMGTGTAVSYDDQEVVKKWCSYNYPNGTGSACYANGLMLFYYQPWGQVWFYNGATDGYETSYLYFKDQQGLIIAVTENGQAPLKVELSEIADIVLKYLNSKPH